MLMPEEIQNYTIFGYDCECGEWVEVWRQRNGVVANPPASKTASCSKGHEQTLRATQIVMLPRRQEKVQ